MLRPSHFGRLSKQRFVVPAQAGTHESSNSSFPRKREPVKAAIRHFRASGNPLFNELLDPRFRGED
jgi:hypothetical protein